jgi:hypothetical protein
MRPSSRTLIRRALLVATLALTGCGGSGDGGLPPELVGTYETTLEKGDLPSDPPPELVDGGLDWKLTIATSGGPGDGPVLVIDSASEFGNLEAPALRIDGDRLLLDDEECFEDGSYVFHDNEYRWSLEGSTLKLIPIVNDCEDEIALTILASRPWTKTS